MEQVKVTFRRKVSFRFNTEYETGFVKKNNMTVETIKRREWLRNSGPWKEKHLKKLRN
jgi:hypothetical protein